MAPFVYPTALLPQNSRHFANLSLSPSLSRTARVRSGQGSSLASKSWMTSARRSRSCRGNERMADTQGNYFYFKYQSSTYILPQCSSHALKANQSRREALVKLIKHTQRKTLYLDLYIVLYIYVINLILCRYNNPTKVDHKGCCTQKTRWLNRRFACLFSPRS